MSYSDPIYQTINAHANGAIASVADIFELISPVPGKQGRVVGVSIVATTAVVGANGNILIGTQADADAYGTINVPATSLNAAHAVTLAEMNAIGSSAANGNLPADTVIVISGDGNSTSGAIDLAITIAWF